MLERDCQLGCLHTTGKSDSIYSLSMLSTHHDINAVSFYFQRGPGLSGKLDGHLK